MKENKIFNGNMREKPIGIFDSGLGGLTFYKALSSIMPNENIVYFGDTARVPYGEVGREEIVRYINQAVNFFHDLDVKMIITACGTVSSFIEDVDFGNIPVEGVIKSSVLSAIRGFSSGGIGVMCTSATAKSKSYEKEFLKLGFTAQTYTRGCPKLASLIEKGIVNENDKELMNVLNDDLKIFKENHVDTVILGCTHYPIIKNVIKKVIGENVNLIDPGTETAKIVKEKLESANLNNPGIDKKSEKFFVSGDPELFVKTANDFLNRDIALNVEKIDISKY